jgi:predicted nuclease with RNAse H fold
MAIDAPLGFPAALVDLITQRVGVEPDQTSGLNRYLFRHTERHLFERGLTPLSAVKDMIGSQATKAMHALAKFAPQVESCGVWTDGAGFRAIETYPAACRKSLAAPDFSLRESLGHDDLNDAYACALVARLYSTDRAALEVPPADVPVSEGWIWAPPMPVPPTPQAHP